jgi:putative addiction module component (TIGR02574 family)
MAPSVADIEKDALALSPEDRARLVVCLLESLDASTDSAEEVEKLWLLEAERRFQEIRTGMVKGIPAEKVFADIRSGRS